MTLPGGETTAWTVTAAYMHTLPASSSMSACISRWDLQDTCTLPDLGLNVHPARICPPASTLTPCPILQQVPEQTNVNGIHTLLQAPVSHKGWL